MPLGWRCRGVGAATVNLVNGLAGRTLRTVTLAAYRARGTPGSLRSPDDWAECIIQGAAPAERGIVRGASGAALWERWQVSSRVRSPAANCTGLTLPARAG